MPVHITDIEVSCDQNEESFLRKHGFTQAHIDLNSGTGGNKVYLWYKSSDCPAITRIQFSFNEEMTQGLVSEGYHKIDKNLNAGNTGNPIYLWYFRGSTQYDIPIVELDFATEAESDAKRFQPQWERMACDLNRHAGGKWIYLWVKRASQPFICDITATDSFEEDANMFRQGFIRVDEDTNRDTPKCSFGSPVFIWYRQTTDSQEAIKDLQVSIDQESVETYQNQFYEQVQVDLNQGTKGVQVYLWYKKNECVKDPIKTVTLILDLKAVDKYTQAGVEVIKKNLNEQSGGIDEFLCFYF